MLIRLAVITLAWVLVGPAMASFDDCVSCHQQRDTHGRCQDCHSGQHDGTMAARSRPNGLCTSCHQGEVGGYLLSKHGVIVTLQGKRWDDSLPLKEGNMRAPTCAYCHYHGGEHPVRDRSDSCRDCHSPRFIEIWFASGDRMVEIGRMKVREAERVIAGMEKENSPFTQQARDILQQMVASHLRNLRLGVGHQSPDDQWWHGQPALDGDLLRIKALMSEHLRKP